MIRRTFDSFKKSFHPIIEVGQWQTDAERESVIQKILGMKKFPMKELLDVLASAYTISNRKNKTELLRILEDILIRAKQTEAGETLITLLRDTADPEIRETVIRVLSKIADDSLLPSIFVLFRNPKRKFRLAAMKLMEMYPRETIAAQLSDELMKGTWTDLADPLNFLFGIDQNAALQPSRRALEIGNETDKVQALKILTTLKTPEAIRALEYVVEDESVRIRMQVAKAFSQVPGPISIRNLVKLANDPKPDVILTALDGLRTMRSPAGIPAVLHCIKHENFSIRIQAIETLGEIGTADEVEYLTNGLKDSDIRIRQAALDALVSLSQNEETDIPKFVSILMSDPDVNVRRAAAQILGQVDAPGLFEKLFDYLKDEDWWVRETIAETLSKIKDDRIYPAAVDLLANPDPSLRRYAIEILEGLQDKRALVPLLKMLKDSDWWVRERAISSLGKIGDKKIVPILANLLSIKELAYITAEALGEIGDEEAGEFLLKALENNDAETKMMIMTSLGKLQYKPAIPVIESLLSDPNREIRFHAKEILTRLKADIRDLDQVTSRWWEQHEFSLMDTLLLEVRYRNASDLFLVSNNPPLARIKGEMIPLTSEVLTEDQIMAMAGQILTSEQEMQFKNTNDLDFSYEITGEGRFRGNMFRHAQGLNLIFRLLPEDIPALASLNLPEFIYSLTKMRHGLVLVSGPASCGKTTTLAAIIDEINTTRTDHIITLEDPIEYVHSRKNCLVTQREVGRHTLSFARALRAALREDPDVILVGELRDQETISMALTAAETGHLVFATLHAISTTKTIERIIDTFSSGWKDHIQTMLAESLKVILTQQLIPSIDGDSHVIAMEILVNTPAIASLIRDSKLHQIPSMITTGQQYGMIGLDQSLMTLFRNGVISIEDAYTRALDKNQFEPHLKSAREKK
ncbi:PilT/PilU family type 4a pilus ATPase [bacterium]|nr:PilT/PilU family type 4a pilus ATPase [candidate division CSSED10-310 bacterium]